MNREDVEPCVETCVESSPEGCEGAVVGANSEERTSKSADHGAGLAVGDVGDGGSPGVVDLAWAECRESGDRPVARAGRYDPVRDQPIGWLDVE